MKVKELISQLEKFDGDMKVNICVQQQYEDDLVMGIEWEVEEKEIITFDGKRYNAALIIQDCQCGILM